MAKINIAKLHHQEESENPTPPKPKGSAKNYSCAELHDRDLYPIIYYHTHVIRLNLNHGSINCKFPSYTYLKK